MTLHTVVCAFGRLRIDREVARATITPRITGSAKCCYKEALKSRGSREAFPGPRTVVPRPALEESAPGRVIAEPSAADEVPRHEAAEVGDALRTDQPKTPLLAREVADDPGREAGVL